jgi:hypothetical protein
MLREAVDSLSSMVTPLSNLADRFPLRPRCRRPRFSAGIERIIDTDQVGER